MSKSMKIEMYCIANPDTGGLENKVFIKTLKDENLQNFAESNLQQIDIDDADTLTLLQVFASLQAAAESVKSKFKIERQ